MDELEQKLGAVLSNPQLMQQIMNMAQSLRTQGSEPPAKPQEKPSGPDHPAPPPASSVAAPQLDLAMLQKLSGLAQQSNIDRQQRELLHALSPYLSTGRIQKLERAMRAAKLAQVASSALNQTSAPGKGR